jgi:hypothetical protein
MSNRKRRAGLKQLRWRVTLRGELRHVHADNWQAACERAVRRWQISKAEQEELSVKRDDPA